MSKAVVIPECKKDIGGMKDDISLSPSEKRDGAMSFFSRLLRLESLKRSSSNPESPTPTEPPATYYGVYIPCEIKKGPDEETLHVYKNKSEALELVKRYKQSRFKAFHNRQDAVAFALRGADPADNHEGIDSSLMGEKPYPFKAPSSQELVALRRAIEAGQAEVVRDRVWDNPRFLVSSGNTPSILQEGCRYNALHAAAKAKNAEICNLILTTVGNPDFVQTLYGSDSDPEACKEFAEILLDRYLNTPDKARHETPLHFAATYGADAVVDVLTAFPQCNVLAVNKFGKQAKDVICERCSTASAEVRTRIASLLSPRYYVPVLHAEDGSAAPALGLPFTPARPPELNHDPLSPRYEIRAYAGPMDATKAASFRRCWKTPPRRPVHSTAFRLRDPVKGLEGVGRSLAEEMKVDWKEYWPFLDTFTDLRSTEGLTLLENYLKAKYENACSFAYSDSCIEAHHYPDELSNLSISRLTLGSITNSPTKDASMSPMSELCVAMKTCKITYDNRSKIDPFRQKLCRQPSLKSTIHLNNGETSPVISHTVSQLLCIERTCQVFAKRIADALTFSLNAEPEVAGESLKSEAKHLQHTIHTYMDDERFKNIDFALIHSRLAQLVVHKLKQNTKELDDINNLVEFLIKLRCPNDDIFSSDDERKPINCRGLNKVKNTQVIDNHVRCLSSFICEELTDSENTKGPAVSESVCIEIWGKLSKCRCDWKVETFERNSKKNTSFRKNRSILSGCSKNDFVKRLTFDHDIGDGANLPAPLPLPEQTRNSPGGDTADTGDNTGTGTLETGGQTGLYTLDVDKCRVVAAEISEDDTDLSDEGSAYLTADDAVSDDDMADASDAAMAEPFIYGEEPTKMDRLVFDALSECPIKAEQYPNLYRWRHTVALYKAADRDKWRDHQTSDVTIDRSPPPSSPLPLFRSTPHKERPTPGTPGTPGRGVPLQMSNWLHVTGPNSPRSALAAKNIGHNVSFGF